jgi:uroporphyrinogen III methyltransferase/synthase
MAQAAKQIGKVTLVGAGPGDVGLLTLKGRQVLESAQVVVYDRLVGDDVLALIPPEAERINVGKEASHHLIPQWRINEILLEQALSGKNVVRLKGGDPFLFGRGGEELELLAEHHVPFEVVPGITSALSVPAYAGIPVTHRDFCSSLHIITGHARADQPLTIDFDALVRTKGTLVFLMGVSALPRICEGLLAAGMDPETPAATVENGTRPNQRKTVATLATLAHEAERRGVHSPAIILVGKVCTLSDQFDWFDRLPLKGRTVVVTRPRDRAGTLSRRLRKLGAQVVEYPCIETKAKSPCPALAQAMEALPQYDWLAFTSPAGVEVFFDRLRAMGKDARALAGVKVAVIGGGTARALAGYGLHADLVPEVFDAEHLAQALTQVRPKRVLLCRAELGTPVLPQVLQQAGIDFTDVRAYDTIYRSDKSEEVAQLLRSGEEVLVTFTSASTVTGFVRSLEKADLSRVLGLCIGVQTQAEAERLGLRTAVAERATMDALVELATSAASS